MNKWYFVSKIVLTFSEKTFFLRSRVFLEIQVKAKNLHIFEITRSIFLNSERWEQLLKQNTFLTCYWKFLEIE